jgi:hypothetical protein
MSKKLYSANCKKVESILNNASILHYSQTSKDFTVFYVARFESNENISRMGISFVSMFNLLYDADLILPDTNNEKVIFLNEKAHDGNNCIIAGMMEITVYIK